MKKTLSFACLHFTVAFTVAYLLTGNALMGGLIALIEPAVNTVAFYFHDKAWNTFKWLSAIEHSTQVKTMSFAVMHFSIAFGVSYIITGNALVGGIMAAIEPSINTCVYYFHEQFWQRKSVRNAPNFHRFCSHG